MSSCTVYTVLWKFRFLSLFLLVFFRIYYSALKCFLSLQSHLTLCTIVYKPGDCMKSGTAYMTSAVLVGLLSHESECSPNLINVLSLAKETGITVWTHLSQCHMTAVCVCPWRGKKQLFMCVTFLFRWIKPTGHLTGQLKMFARWRLWPTAAALKPSVRFKVAFQSCWSWATACSDSLSL